MKKRMILILVFTTAIRLTCSAQQVWSLQDCMRYAIENAPRHKIQELLNSNTEKDYRDAMLSFLPSVSGTINGYGNFGRVLNSNNTYDDNKEAFRNYYGGSANLPLFNGFSVLNNFKISKIARQMGKEELQVLEDEIALTTLQAYYNVIYSYGMVRLAREQLDETRKQLHNTVIQAELGLKGRPDILQFEAEVATNDYNLIKQENLYRDYVLQLKEVMFYPISQELQIDTVLRWGVNLLDETQAADSIYQNALDFLPQAKLASFGIQASKLEWRTAKASLLPSVSLAGNLNSYYYYVGGAKNLPYNTQMSGNLEKQIGLSMSIPLFSGLKRQSDISRARNIMKIREQERDQTLMEIEAAIQRAVQDMEGSSREYTQSVKSVIAEQEAYRVNLRKYEEGLLSSLELQTSRNKALNAKVAELDTYLRYMLNQRVVHYYRGTSYINQEF